MATNNLSDKFEKIDSFGTGSWHVGDTPDHRSAATCRENGVPVNHRAQQIVSFIYTTAYSTKEIG